MPSITMSLFWSRCPKAVYMTAAVALCGRLAGPGCSGASRIVPFMPCKHDGDLTGNPAGLEDMPGVPAAVAKSKASAVHIVAKGRQDVAAANSVQV